MANEKRLIDANKIYDAVERRYQVSSGVEHQCERDLLDLICSAETVDAVEVVRCKDCKHCYKSTSSSTNYRCKVWGVYDTDCEVTPEHFCSYGERKDNESKRTD